MTMTVPDMQSQVIARLKEMLASVAQVEEGDVRRMLDAEDDGLPDELIILQPGTTEEVKDSRRQLRRGIQELMQINVVLVSKKRQYAADLRTLRLSVKLATAGLKCGLDIDGVSAAEYQQETPTHPTDGSRWAAHVMPLQVTYIQPLG